MTTNDDKLIRTQAVMLPNEVLLLMRYSSDVKDVASAVSTIPIHSRENVLPTMADPGAADTETCQSGVVANPCHVYGALLDRVLPGT